jgi:cytochrome c oxidase subunit 2
MPRVSRLRIAATFAAMAAWSGALSADVGLQDTAAGEPRVIEVIVKRFAFEPARIEVTQGERVRLMVRSADGVHGLEIKKFRVNKPVPRGGEPVAIDFVASAPGTYEILCSEYCGDGHETMTGSLVVQAKAKGK